MSEKISRRDFLKLSGIGAAAVAVLTGCGPASRYVTRRPYTDMPEYNQTGSSTYYASGCRECPAGCGVIARTFEGRAIKLEGNPNHPVNRGKLCSRGLTSMQGLYNPDRVKAPHQNSQRGGSASTELGWDAALTVVQDALTKNDPNEVAFLLGTAPDHLFDLVKELTSAMGAPAPLRYGAYDMFEARRTLVDACKTLLGKPALPYFDLGAADAVITFGAGFLETWLSPLTYARGYGNLRQGHPARGQMIAVEPRLSMTAGNADLWLPAAPGTEGLVALALGKLVADKKSLPVPAAYADVDVAAAAQTAGISMEKLAAAADILANATKPLAIPGAALTHAGGLAAAQAILGLNLLWDNVGKTGGVFFAPGEAEYSSFEDVTQLVSLMEQGRVKVLFIHGVNPVFELPAALKFTEALAKVPLVISFASFPDETAAQSDYVLPDHTMLESWGYQRILPGADRPTLTSFQPVVVPLYQTRSTVDVLLGAAKAAGGSLSAKLPYTDEVDFLQQKLVPLLEKGAGFFAAPEILTFWSQWLQYGGWWTPKANPEAPTVNEVQVTAASTPPAPLESGQFYLVTFPTQMGDGSGANRPWLQETPDPMTTLMWNSWVEIHPETAKKLGIKDDDVVKITSATGEIEASVYLYPGLRPDVVAMPFGQGHTALGRWAQGRGANPAKLLTVATNEAADLAFGDTRVSITPTGRRRQLSRLESREGVYGE